MGIGPGYKMDVWAAVSAWNSVGAKLNEGTTLLHDIAHAHVDHIKLWGVFKLPAHIPNTRPCNFLTFGQLKKVLKFTSDEIPDDCHSNKAIHSVKHNIYNNQHYKLGNMFRFIEPSSGQFLKRPQVYGVDY